jgi:DNA-binding CsgD family transcriptional regulator
MTISDRDLRTMLEIANCRDGGDSTVPMPWAVLHGLRELISCDGVAFFHLDSTHQEMLSGQDLPHDDLSQAQGEDLSRAFWKHYLTCRPCSYPDDTGDLTSVITLSDFYSQRELRATGMYADYFKPYAVEHEILMCLPSPRYRTLRLLLYRGRGPDFSDRDRALLTLLRPHLYATYREGAQPPAPDLTTRQHELLRLVAAGYTNGQIARRLAVADSTVRKHLENIFERLQVSSRTAAVARVLGATAEERWSEHLVVLPTERQRGAGGAWARLSTSG